MQTLNDLLSVGLLTELDYLSADDQAEAIQREAFLLSCDGEELADAADFISLVVTQ